MALSCEIFQGFVWHIDIMMGIIPIIGGHNFELKKNADHLDFLKLLLSFYGQIPNPQASKKFQDVIPAVVKNSQNFLKNQGCKYISLLGVCWGGLVTQKIISTGKFQNRSIKVQRGQCVGGAHLTRYTYAFASLHLRLCVLHVTKTIFEDDSFTSMVSIDGLYYDKDFSAKSPSLFLIGNEPHREQTFEAMEEVMWSNNLGLFFYFVHLSTSF